jgi:hypothetical protein
MDMPASLAIFIVWEKLKIAQNRSAQSSAADPGPLNFQACA